MLDEVIKEQRNSAAASSQSSATTSQPIIPSPGPDRDALIRWAYYEATVFIQQYGDLLEDVKRYMRAGTTVGECAMLIETELSG